MENVYIKNPEELKKKIEKIKKEGKENFHVVADFDKTLTKEFVKGQKCHTTIAQIREGNYLSEEYVKKSSALFDKYHPIELSHEITREEKIIEMNNWWSAHLKLLVESGMNKGIINDIISNDKIVGRDGFFDLLDLLKENNIPILILSAGLGDVIEEFLKSKNKLSKNLHIISNYFEFDKNGKIKGYTSQIIHCLNKDEVAVKEHPYYKEVKERKNVILMGDSLEDIDMAKGIEHECIIKIGFLNSNVDKLLDKYSETFDVLILNDSSMEYINKLIKEIMISNI